MTELCFLGTGGWVATPERDNVSFLFSREDSLILVECCGSVVQKIKRLGFDPRRTKAVLVSHVHPDHVYGLPSLVHSLMFEECRIQICGSEAAVGFCAEFLDLFGLRKKEMTCRLEWRVLEPGKSSALIPGIDVTPVSVLHHPSSLAFLFHFRKERKKILYSGDTSAYPPLFKAAVGVDYLIHDCSVPQRFFEEHPPLAAIHTPSLELGRLAQEAEVPCLVPCHFFGGQDFTMGEIEEEIRVHYRGRLIIPEDGQKISL